MEIKFLKKFETINDSQKVIFLGGNENNVSYSFLDGPAIWFNIIMSDLGFREWTYYLGWSFGWWHTATEQQHWDYGKSAMWIGADRCYTSSASCSSLQGAFLNEIEERAKDFSDLATVRAP